MYVILDLTTWQLLQNYFNMLSQCFLEWGGMVNGATRFFGNFKELFNTKVDLLLLLLSSFGLNNSSSLYKQALQSTASLSDLSSSLSAAGFSFKFNFEPRKSRLRVFEYGETA